MDKLSCIKTFIEVARTKSFTIAAQRRGLSRASVTKHVSALEEMIGARLLTRNSQFVSLTDAGSAMLEGGGRIIEDLEGLSEYIRGNTEELSGQVRVGVPPAFGTHQLVPAIADFLTKVKNIDIILSLDDGRSNLVREGLDISIRIKESLPSTDEVAKLLADAPQFAVASPDYIARYGMPKTPVELKDHQCLVHTIKSGSGEWSFTGADGVTAVHVSGKIRSNFGEPLLTAALMGQGISIHPLYMVKEYLDKKSLVVVMPDYEPTRLRIHAIYPQRRFLPARIRVFLDFLRSWLIEHSDQLEGS